MSVKLMMFVFSAGGYPNSYGSSPLQPGGLSRKDCAIVEGLNQALCFAFRSDNTGPPKDYKVKSINYFNYLVQCKCK